MAGWCLRALTADDPERDECEAAWTVFERWQKPLLMLWGELCPFTHGDLGRSFRSRVPGARLPGIEHRDSRPVTSARRAWARSSRPRSSRDPKLRPS